MSISVKSFLAKLRTLGNWLLIAVIVLLAATGLQLVHSGYAITDRIVENAVAGVPGMQNATVKRIANHRDSLVCGTFDNGATLLIKRPISTDRDGFIFGHEFGVYCMNRITKSGVLHLFDRQTGKTIPYPTSN